MFLDDVSRLLLYWVSDYSQASLPVPHRTAGSDLYHEWLLRDCYSVGIPVPTDQECVEALQVLVESKHLIAYSVDNRGDEKQVTRLSLAKISHEETYFELTDQGEQEAYEFVEFLQSEIGRSRTVEFSRRRVHEGTADLSFTVVVPEYLPPTFDPLAILIRHPDSDGVTLRYYEWGDDQLFVDETVLELGEGTPETAAVIKHDRISGADVVIYERLLGPTWAEISINWKQRGTSFRVSYHKTQGDLEVSDAEDAEPAEFEWTVDEAASGFDINESMRNEARRVAESIIREAT